MPKAITSTLLVILFILFYFFLLRPLRGEVNRVLLKPLVEQSIHSDHIISYDLGSTVSNRIEWSDGNSVKELFLKIPFGLNFLIAVTGLIILGADTRFLWILCAIQLLGGFISVLTFYSGTISSASFLIITDLTMRYLTPLCSLGIVPLAFIHQRQKENEG